MFKRHPRISFFLIGIICLTILCVLVNLTGIFLLGRQTVIPAFFELPENWVTTNTSQSSRQVSSLKELEDNQAIKQPIVIFVQKTYQDDATICVYYYLDTSSEHLTLQGTCTKPEPPRVTNVLGSPYYWYIYDAKLQSNGQIQITWQHTIGSFAGLVGFGLVIMFAFGTVIAFMLAFSKDFF